MEKFAVGRRQAYYELFKACRLCGSGGGYKMPIVQTDSSHSSRSPLGDNEPELRHKIRDCCSIDVHLEDKMPPLICELCVDKVNDFYEFREMCRVTNSRVRVSLGLPPQNLNQDTSDDCILGVSGPLIFNSKELEMSQNSTQRPIKLKVSLRDKKSPKILPSRHSPILERRSLKKERTPENQSLLSERLTKRKRATEPSSSNNVLIKKLRFSDPPAKSISPNKVEKRASPNEPVKKSKDLPLKKVAFSPHFCKICKTSFTKSFSLKQHLITQHSPNILPEKFGCAPCHEWFPSVKLAEEHHKWHRNTSTFYNCDRCSTKFKVLHGYTRHFKLKQCIPETRVPDIVCSECQQSFVTNYLMEQHRCSGPPFTGDCSKCKKHFIKRISLKKHESMCKKSASPQVNPNNPYLKALKPIQISMLKCDGLLEKIKKEPVDNEDLNPIYDVSRIPNFPGFMVKSEPVEFGFNDSCEMDIKPEIKTEYPDYNFDYGDVANDDYSSNESGSDAETSQTPNFVINPFARKNNTQVESLSFISLRSIFSNKIFKKKNRPKRITPKIEKSYSKSPFDSLLGESSKSTENNRSIGKISVQSSSVFVNANSENGSNSDETSVSNVQNIENPISEESLDFEKINNGNVENTENSSANVAHFDNINVLDRITITSVEGNTSMNFENDSGKICDEQINNVFDLEESSQNKENSSNIETLEKTLTNNVVKSPVSQGLLQSNNGVIVCNSINKSLDIDFDIDSVLRDNLDSSIIKETTGNEIQETQNKIDDFNNVENLLKSEDFMLNIETQNKSDDLNNVEDLLKAPEDLGMETETQNKRDDLNNVEDLLKAPEDLGIETETQNKRDDSNSAEDLLKSSEELMDDRMNIEISNKSDDLNNVEDLFVTSEDLNMDIETQNKSNDLNSAESVLKSSEDLNMDIVTQNKSDDFDSAEDLLKSKDLMNIETQNKSNDFNSAENVLKTSEDLNMEIEMQSKSDDLNSVESSLKSSEEISMDYEIQKNNDILGVNKTSSKILDTEISSIALNSANNLLKNLQDTRLHDVLEKSDSDILDLVSDSGDDCNIIDSPEKFKVLEDQLLLEEINDEKVQEIETGSSTLPQNNGSLSTQKFSEYDIGNIESKLENGTLLEIENKVSSELLDPQLNLPIIQEKNASNYSNSSSLNIDSTINQSNASEIDKLLDNVNVDGALHDVDADKPSDGLTH